VGRSDTGVPPKTFRTALWTKLNELARASAGGLTGIGLLIKPSSSTETARRSASANTRLDGRRTVLKIRDLRAFIVLAGALLLTGPAMLDWYPIPTLITQELSRSILSYSSLAGSSGVAGVAEYFLGDGELEPIRLPFGSCSPTTAMSRFNELSASSAASLGGVAEILVHSG
jgi:hypothetical protein